MTPIRVQFNTVGVIQAGVEAAYGNVVGSDGQVLPASTFNINAPKGTGIRNGLDTEQVYEVTFTPVKPVAATPAKK